jgi:uncharacterized membrane protein YccC
MNWTTRQGLVVALSVLAAVVVAGFAGLQDAWWAAISAWAVANADRAQVFAKATMRAFGTVAGCTLGFLLASAFGEHPLLMVLAMFGIGAIGTRRRFGNTRYGYAWILFAVTALMAPASETSAPALTGAASHDFDLDRLSLLGGLLPVAVALIWRELELPAANQIAVSSLVVLDRDLAASHIRGGQRFAGCLVGGLAGLLIAGLGVENVWLWATALGGGLFLFSRIHVGGGPDAYFGTQAGVAFILALVTGLGPPTNVIPAFDRLVGIAFGVAIAIGLAHLLAPLPQLRFWRSSS